MLLIAHRGNLSGPDPSKENEPEYLSKALSAGYDVEVDVWIRDGQFWLGHDAPKAQTSLEFLSGSGVWCHAKDVFALNALLDTGVHCFYHIDDPVTVTSMGFIWGFPGIYPTERSIAVLPEKFATTHSLSEFYGICTDYAEEYAGKF